MSTIIKAKQLHQLSIEYARNTGVDPVRHATFLFDEKPSPEQITAFLEQNLNTSYVVMDTAKWDTVDVYGIQAPPQSRCCCPPQGFTGAWGAGPCPVHHGLRARGNL